MSFSPTTQVQLQSESPLQTQSQSFTVVPGTTEDYSIHPQEITVKPKKKHRKKNKKDKKPQLDHRTQCLHCHKLIEECHCKRGKEQRKMFAMIGLSFAPSSSSSSSSRKHKHKKSKHKSKKRSNKGKDMMSSIPIVSM